MTLPEMLKEMNTCLWSLFMTWLMTSMCKGQRLSLVTLITKLILLEIPTTRRMLNLALPLLRITKNVLGHEEFKHGLARVLTCNFGDKKHTGRLLSIRTTFIKIHHFPSGGFFLNGLSLDRNLGVVFFAPSFDSRGRDLLQ